MIEVIPAGKNKGTRIADLSDNQLKWYAENWQGEDVKASARAEMDRRQGGAQTQSQPAPGGQSQLATRPRKSDLSASYNSHQAATNALQQAAQQCHLVSPASWCPELPLGHVLAMSQVVVSEEETYSVSGNRGLTKVALDKIAAAAGVSWDPTLTGRLDDGSNPHYCHFRAVAHYKAFDGTHQTLVGTVEIDARDGSPQIESMSARQLNELRRFIIRHAESKAMNRAIRKLGIRTSYSASELEKPFIVAKLQFTGRSDNPEIARVFAQAIADKAMGSRGALFGSPAPAPAMPPAPPGGQLPVGHPPPPVGDYEAPDSDRSIEAPGQPVGDGLDDRDPSDPEMW